MTSLLPVLLALLPTPALEPGTWLPTPGPAGQRPVLALAAGGDGALYAAGRGFVYRMQAGQAWEAVGWYVPQIAWDQDQGFEATGPFPAPFLQRVEDELQAALETRLGFEADAGSVSEDLVLELIEDAAQEADPAADSPWAVARMAPAPTGVWLGTGGGVFRASASGVEGPISDLWPVLDLTATDRELVVASPTGLHRVVDGKAQRWRQFAATSLARVEGRAAFVAEGSAWWDDGQVGPRALTTPTGLARLVASGGDVLWVATELAIYRWSGDAFSLCPSISEAPHRLVSTGDLLLAVGDQVVYATDRHCSKWTRHDAPWLGGLRFTDATMTPAGVWAATTEGVFLLAPADSELAALTEVEGLRRKLSAVPDLDAVYRAALVEHALSPEQTGYGSRPIWRMLLPDIKLSALSAPQRIEDDIRLDGGPLLPAQVEVAPAEVAWQVVAVWNINFDFLTLLLDSDAAGGELGEAGVVELEDGEDFQDARQDLEADDREVEPLVSVELSGDETADAEALDQASIDLLVAERSQVRKSRGTLFTEVRRLYKERLRLLYQMHTTRAALGPVDLLRLAELDARLDAYTGGAWSKALDSSPSGVR